MTGGKCGSSAHGQQVFHTKARQGGAGEDDARPGFADEGRRALEIFGNAQFKARVA